MSAIQVRKRPVSRGRAVAATDAARFPRRSPALGGGDRIGCGRPQGVARAEPALAIRPTAASPSRTQDADENGPDGTASSFVFT
jgi:hypothetical protein